MAAVVATFIATQPEPVTGEFDERTARMFSIAAANAGDPAPAYRVTTLEDVRERDPSLAAVDYRLGQSEIRIDVGDIHYVRVLEEHGDWQLIEFTYNNSYMGKSVYKAFADRVEPVSFHMVSHVGQAMMALMLSIPAYCAAVIITFVRNRRESARQRRE